MMIEQGTNRMKILNVLWAAERACSEPTVENLETLRWALDALPKGWVELVNQEIEG